MAESDRIHSQKIKSTAIEISICIVTHNCSNILERCLKSLSASTESYISEIIVVDNHSSDNTRYMLKNEFPHVQLICNENNVGFATGINQGIAVALGRYIVILNPDTIVSENSISILAEFLDNHPNTAICGPKVYNEDGTFQKSCRRGVSRPWPVISYFIGLDKLFPMNPTFNGYHLSHIDENKQTEVGGLSGSCMMIRYETLETIGNFDEQFFVYQEDSDICIRVLDNNWNIYYIPTANIIHTGGEGGTADHILFLLFHWHLSYYKLYKKHFSKDYNSLFNLLFYLMMGIKFILSFFTLPFRK